MAPPNGRRNHSQSVEAPRSRCRTGAAALRTGLARMSWWRTAQKTPQKPGSSVAISGARWGWAERNGCSGETGEIRPWFTSTAHKNAGRRWVFLFRRSGAGQAGARGGRRASCLCWSGAAPGTIRVKKLVRLFVEPRRPSKKQLVGADQRRAA